MVVLFYYVNYEEHPNGRCDLKCSCVLEFTPFNSVIALMEYIQIFTSKWPNTKTEQVYSLLAFGRSHALLKKRAVSTGIDGIRKLIYPEQKVDKIQVQQTKKDFEHKEQALLIFSEFQVDQGQEAMMGFQKNVYFKLFI